MLPLSTFEFPFPDASGNVGEGCTPPEHLDGTPLRVDERIGFEPANDAVCTAIGLSGGSVALLCHVLGYGVGDVPVYSQIYHIPPNRRRLEVRERKP